MQSRTVAEYPKDIKPADYDGNAQLWFDDMESFNAYAASDNYRDIIAIDEHKFNDGKPDLLFSEEVTMVA